MVLKRRGAEIVTSEFLYIIFGVLDFFFYVLVEIGLFYTGEFALYPLTLGRRRPRLNRSSNEKVTKKMVLTDLSTWTGLILWAAIVILVIALLHGNAAHQLFMSKTGNADSYCLRYRFI